MKKILIVLLLLIVANGVFGQNKYKYLIQALGGLSIGNTADTARIDSVILSGNTLKIYRGSQLLTLPASGYTWIDSANYYTKVFNVIEYGAVPDDGLDDAAAIQAAADAADAVHGTVFIPSGVYHIDMTGTTIDLGDSVRLIGAGIDKTILQAIPATALNENEIINCPANSYIQISDMTLKSHVTSNAGYHVRGIWSSTGSKYLLVERVKFLDFYSGLRPYAGGQYIKVYECEFASSGDITTRREMNGIMAYAPGSNDTCFIEVDNCYFHNMGINHNHHGIYTLENYDVTVRGCRFEHINGYAIQFWGPSTDRVGARKIVTDCQIDSCGYGIYLPTDTLGTALVKNNTITRIKYNGLRICGSKAIVEGNYFADIGSYAITPLENAYYANITNNIFRARSVVIYNSKSTAVWHVAHNTVFNVLGTGSTIYFVQSTAGIVYTHDNHLYYGVTNTGTTDYLEVLDDYAPLASPNFTGTATFNNLHVDGSAEFGNTGLTIDSIRLVDGRVAMYDGTDTLGYHIIAADVANLEDVAVVWYNVKNYGAKGDGVTDDTEEIQACIDVAQAANGKVYIPGGTYLISDTLVISDNYFRMTGDGFNSILYCNTANMPILKVQDCSYVTIENLQFLGNGTNDYGADATNGDAIYLDYCRYSVFDNLLIFHNGGNGIRGINGSFVTTILNSKIFHNKLDGLNFVTNSTQQHSGQNGNQLTVKNSFISANGNDGVEWSGRGGCFTGNSIENHKGSGIQIGSNLGNGSTVGGIIEGNYFEANDSAQVYLVTNATGYVGIYDVVIEGNHMYSVQATGLTGLIVHDAIGSYSWNPADVRIQNNYYEKGGIVAYNVLMEGANSDVIVGHGDLTTGDISIPNGVQVYGGMPMAIPRGRVITEAGITASLMSSIVRCAPASAISVGYIADGLFTGQTIRLTGNSDVNTLTLIDSTGTCLDHDRSCVLGVGDWIELEYNGTDWYEVSRSNIGDTYAGIYSAAGDTSNYPTPNKVGDIFVDTSASKVYIAVEAARGGWIILNFIIVLAFIKRKKKKV